jgi:hypothetical protein
MADAKKKLMSRLDDIVAILLGVGVLAIILLYAMDKLTFDGFLNAVGGLFIFGILLGKISKAPKNPN